MDRKKGYQMNPTLLVLAAGMGSRYGGLKQVDQFGPSGESILDYSIYDSLKVGFKKVVFVIRRDMEKPFTESVIKKFKHRVETDYVFQELDAIPAGYRVAKDRVKPWGTAHAVWVAREKIREPFAVVNADDFYGRGSFKLLHDFLITRKPDEHRYALIGYQLDKTLSEHGYVSRALCEIDKEGFLISIIERTHIFRKDASVVYEDEQGTLHSVKDNPLVSMNMMGFTPAIFPALQRYFMDFLQTEGQNVKAEFFLPSVLNRLIHSDHTRVQIIPTNESWFGVTYKEDKAIVKDKIRQLIEKSLYPPRLWK